MDKFFKEINKYVVSILLLFAGMGFLGKYLSGDALESQPTAMLISSLALIAVAALASPYVLSRLQASHYRIMMIAGTVVAVWLGYEVFYSVDEEIQFRELKTQVDAETIQALKDIRDAQEAHQQIYGVFCDDFDSLQRFIYEPVMPVSFNMGSFNDTLPESKSAEMGLILTRAELPAVAEEMGLSEEELIDLIAADSSTYKVRDVIYTTFYDENFTPEIRFGKAPSSSSDRQPVVQSIEWRTLPIGDRQCRVRRSPAIDDLGEGSDTVWPRKGQERHPALRVIDRSAYRWQLEKLRAKLLACCWLGVAITCSGCNAGI